jgi:hypothetical protein
MHKVARTHNNNNNKKNSACVFVLGCRKISSRPMAITPPIGLKVEVVIVLLVAGAAASVVI